MRGVVHSILERRPEAAARRLEETPEACALVELRADALRAGDVAGLVRRAGKPVVVTVRAIEDGGAFDGSTAEKRAILNAGLDAGAAFVDVEWDGPLRDLALGAEGGRTILSHHGGPCDAAALSPLYAAMAETKAIRLKIVPRATRPAELGAVYDLLARARDERRALCSFASGPAGTFSRVAALLWGSWGTYGAASSGRLTGEGQLETRVMLTVYRVHAISQATTAFALCGTPLSGSPSPAMHAAGYEALGLDAVYVPLESDALDDVTALTQRSGPLAIAGFGVTMPLKEHAARRCSRLDPFAACGSANTVVLGEDGWSGFNTDAPAALALIRKHLDPRGRTVAVAGAGGTARAIAAALASAGAIVTIYSRSAAKGEETARAVGVAAAPLSALPGATWEVLVQATPAGRHGEEILLRRHLTGRMVLDAAYGEEPTPLVKAARSRGLAVADGLDLLGEQAALQFTCLTGRAAPRPAMAAALEPWRSASTA